MPYRLGVDVGGTFTDLILMDETSGAFVAAKTPSQPAAPQQAITSGLLELPGLFHARHQAVYGFADESGAVEMINLRVQAVGQVRKPERLAPREAISHQPSAISSSRRRQVTLDGTTAEAAVHRRAELSAGAAVEGPAIITQYDTTTFVPPGYQVTVDDWLNLIGEAT